MKDGERFFLCGEWITYRTPELLDSAKLDDKPNTIINIGDPITILISGEPTDGIVEEIYKYPQHENPLIKVRLTSTRYTTVSILSIEYRGYGKNGFYEKL